MDAERKKSRRCVKQIIDDISDRRGLKREWDLIDDDVKKQIRDAWEKIVGQYLEDV